MIKRHQEDLLAALALAVQHGLEPEKRNEIAAELKAAIIERERANRELMEMLVD